MDARNALQRIVAIVKMAYAILVIVAGACGGAVYAGPAHNYSGDFNLPIPAKQNSSKGWMTDAVIKVPAHLIISDLDIGIALTHTNAFDLQIFLQSPNGTRICLNTYNFYEFFKGGDYIQTIFDDEAALPIEHGAPPFIGQFRPLEPYKLSKFDDEDACGSWRLQIYDAFYADTGTLNSFELTITAPEPNTALLLTLAAGLMRLRKRPKQKL